jgi:hypothetical protein
MKAIVTIIIVLLIALAAWLAMRGPDETADVGSNPNPASVIQAGVGSDSDVDLGEFLDKV